jgi:hypothetical protein
MGLGKNSLLTKFDNELRRQPGGDTVADSSDPAGFFTAPEDPVLPKRQAPPKTLFGDSRDTTRRSLAKKKGRRANVLTLDKLGKNETVLG